MSCRTNDVLQPTQAASASRAGDRDVRPPGRGAGSHFASEPTVLPAILGDTAAHGFGMASEHRVGALLRVLAASRPAGRVLELGTGTGVGAAWLLEGMGPA